MTQVGLGDDFAIALGLTLPQHEYARLAAQNGVLKQMQPENSKPNIRRIRAGARSSNGRATHQINYNEVMQRSHGKAGEDSCALRQKSLASANTT